MNITQHELLERFDYDHESGRLIYKYGRHKGLGAGTVDKDGYRRIRIAGKSYVEHRLVWLMLKGDLYPEENVRHIDGDKLNNGIENLAISVPDNDITQAEVQELFEYDYGRLYWKHGRVTDVPAGTDTPKGRKIMIYGKPYYEHRLVWLMLKGLIYPGESVRHVDGDNLNNKIENLFIGVLAK